LRFRNEKKSQEVSRRHILMGGWQNILNPRRGGGAVERQVRQPMPENPRQSLQSQPFRARSARRSSLDGGQLLLESLANQVHLIRVHDVSNPDVALRVPQL
jgi:hypothetical protein